MNTDETLVLIIGSALIILAVMEFWRPQFGALFTAPSSGSAAPSSGPAPSNLKNTALTPAPTPTPRRLSM